MLLPVDSLARKMDEENMINGKSVRPPSWNDVLDLYDDGEYSAIWGCYANGSQRVLGVRWNGYDTASNGFPLSSGCPVWYIEPDFLAKDILSTLLMQTLSSPKVGGNRNNILTALDELSMRYDPNRLHVAIALYAAGNRGKTITLNMLIDMLKANGAKIVDEIAVNNGADRCFCCKHKGRTVGVATGGDDGNAINVNFDFFDKYNCDIVFCATRLKANSSSWRAFYDRTDYYYVRVVAIKKDETAIIANQLTMNARQANDLMNMIN